MDVKSLYAFIAVVDHGGFAVAARALGVSVSSISIQMRDLEQDVGLLLFDRTRRPPVLTGDGHDFAVRARDVIVRWERLSEGLTRPSGKGVLKIGAVHTAVAGLLPAALSRLRAKMPELGVRLTTGLTHELETAVRGGRVDAAIVTEPASRPANVAFKVICEERLVVLAHASVEGGDFRQILAQNPYVRFSRTALVAQQVEAKLRDYGIEVGSQMEVDTLEGVVALVASGLGVSIVPERLGPRPFPETVRAHQLGTPAAVRRLGLLSLEGNARQRFSDRLHGCLVEEARSRARGATRAARVARTEIEPTPDD